MHCGVVVPRSLAQGLETRVALALSWLATVRLSHQSELSRRAAQLLFMLAIWVFLNLLRVLSVMGISRILWRQLNTGLYAFLGTCNVDGVSTYKQARLVHLYGL